MKPDDLLMFSIGLRVLDRRWDLNTSKTGIYAYSVFYQNSPRGHDCHYCRKLLEIAPSELPSVLEVLRTVDDPLAAQLLEKL